MPEDLACSADAVHALRLQGAQVLLQESLRPILVQLGYHSKLQLPLLNGLARLLELLSSWFNITLGAASYQSYGCRAATALTVPIQGLVTGQTGMQACMLPSESTMRLTITLKAKHPSGMGLRGIR